MNPIVNLQHLSQLQLMYNLSTFRLLLHSPIKYRVNTTLFFLLFFAIIEASAPLCTLLHHLDSYRLCRQDHRSTDRLQVNLLVSIVGFFDLGYFVYMLQRHFSYMIMSWFICSFGYVGGLEQEPGRGRRLHLKRERAVGFHRQKTWNWSAGLKIGGSRIELFAKIYGLDTLGTQRRTHWGGGRGLASSHDQFDHDILGGHRRKLR